MKLKGFTLAELLIALAILGVIATFTIPKVLLANQSQQYNALGKEAIGAISEAFQAYKLQNSISASFNPGNVTPYLNYVRVVTNGLLMDHRPPETSWACDSASPCYRLHNGGTLQLFTASCFGGTAQNNAVWFGFDPDSQYSGTTNGPGKALHIALYANGRITTTVNLRSDTQVDWGCGGSPAPQTPVVNGDPSWFSWN
ncbi:MAG: type II secretion system protein [Vampirovibrionales bacterium]|nr:type II secretion system protein [Vampirovibrionales bacterium]